MPELPGSIELRLPGDTSYLPVLMSVAEQAARMAGFGDAEIPQIQLALEEAAVNAIRHGFDPADPGVLTLGFRATATGLEISLRDQGRPFDPLAIPSFDPRQVAVCPEQKGLGTFLMSHMADEVHYRNLGREGMETLIRKHRVSAHGSPPAVEPEGTPIAAAPSSSPGAVSVRRMDPAEAEVVSRCAWEAYRTSYPFEHIYDPAKVRALNASGDLQSYVCVTEGGVVFGHAALVRCERQPSTAEMGVAFVTPKFRGGGALNLLSEAMVADGRRRGLCALWVHAVTSHPFSQKAAHKMGFRDTGLFLSAVGPIGFKGIREQDGCRENLLHACLPLSPGTSPRLAAPARHREILTRICAELGAAPTFLEAAPLPPGESRFDLSSDPYGSAHVRVRSAAADAPERLKRALRTLCVERVEAVYAYLPAAAATTATLSEALEQLGFFFAGYLPGADEEALLAFQYLNNRVVDYAAMQLDSGLGRAIAEHQRRCDPSQAP